MMTHRIATAANLLEPSIPETLKIFSNTTAPEYRMTGRLRMEYITTTISENIVRVFLPKRCSISCGMVVVPIFK